MIRVLEIFVLFCLGAGAVWFFARGIDLVGQWFTERRANRAIAQSEFQKAIKERNRIRIAETLAIHGDVLTKRETKVLLDLHDDVLLDEEGVTVPRKRRM